MKETTMTTKQYTAEDFVNAEFARNPDGIVAARIYDSDTMPWITGDETWLSDAEMAEQGWEPVREAADQPITLDALRDRAYQQSKDKGFHEGTSENVAEKFALIHSEVSEALEEHRAGRGLTETYYRADGKPEGVPAELADTIIRILDFAGWAGIDLETAIVEKLDYNATRPHKHGKAY